MGIDQSPRGIRSARLWGRISGAIAFLAGGAGLSSTLVGLTVPSLDAVVSRVLPLLLLSWIGVDHLTRARLEPAVATLGRLLEQRRGTGPLGGPSSLSHAERSDLAAAQRDVSEGALEHWIVRGWLMLGLSACWAAVDLWQLQEAPRLASADAALYAAFLASAALVIIGSLVAARARWSPILSTLREAVGEAAGRVKGSRGDRAGLAPPQREAAARADAQLRNLVVVAALMLYIAARGGRGPALQPMQILAVTASVAAAFESGYILGRSRSRHVAAELQRSPRSRERLAPTPEDRGD